MSTRRFVGELGKALLDFVYPPSCLTCERGIAEAADYLCAACWEKILGQTQVRCRRCGCPLEREGAFCLNCATWEPDFERAVVLGRFAGPMQQAIHVLKFKHHKELGVELGRRMGGALGRSLEPVDLLVPVPLHPARQRERGYNQSLCIARGLAAVLGVGVESRVVRRRLNTRQQALLDASQRRENLRDSFCCASPLPEHRCIGLVDDVLTTGATLDACTLALFEGGARRVWAVALASPFREPLDP